MQTLINNTFKHLRYLTSLVCGSILLFSALPAQADTEGAESPQLLELEGDMTAALDNYDFPSEYTLLLESISGNQYRFSSPGSSPDTRYVGASASKFVSAWVILYFVEKGVLSLDDNPQDYLDYWPTSGNLSQATLGNLLTFTSGLLNDPSCIYDGSYDFDACLLEILNYNRQAAPTPGSYFSYRSAHLQVAAAMLIEAAQVNSWADIFAEFQQDKGLFSGAAYDSPSLGNPTLAAGLRYTANEYLEFLRAIFHGQFFSNSSFIGELTRYISQNVNRGLTFNDSKPNWYYSLGFWVECTVPRTQCSNLDRISSIGAFGSYPFIDLKQRYFGIIATEGYRGTDRNSYTLTQLGKSTIDYWSLLSR